MEIEKTSLKCNKKTGPKFKTSIDSNRKIVEIVEQNRWKSWREISLILEGHGIKVSPFIIRARSKKVEIQSKVALTKPCINLKTAQRRLIFSRTYLGKGQGFFNKLIFADEASVTLGNDMSRIWVKRRRNEGLLPSIVRKKWKYGGGVGLSFWIFLSIKGLSDIVFIEKKWNANTYVELLRNNLLKEARKLELDNFIMLEDSSKIHTAKITIDFYKENNIQFIHLPGNSPDLNLAENVFYQLKKRVFQNIHKYKNKSQLKRAILREWRKMRRNKDFFKNYYEKYGQRLQAILKNNGYNSKY